MYPYNIEQETVYEKRSLPDHTMGGPCYLAEYAEKYKSVDEVDEKLLNMIIEAIKDKKKNAQFYKALSDSVKMHQEKKLLLKIYFNEVKHCRLLEGLYSDMCGRKAQIKEDFIPRIVHDSFSHNLWESIVEETDAAEFYRHILFSFLNSTSRDIMYEIIIDTQSHIGLLNLMYAKNA